MTVQEKALKHLGVEFLDIVAPGGAFAANVGEVRIERKCRGEQMRIVAVPTGDKSITQNAINGRTGRRLPVRRTELNSITMRASGPDGLKSDRDDT